jgi:hypothetical protein
MLLYVGSGGGGGGGAAAPPPPPPPLPTYNDLRRAAGAEGSRKEPLS